MARLHTAASDAHFLDTYGLYAMIDGLEDPRTPEQLEDVLPAVAAWFLYGGKMLFNNDIRYVDHGDDVSKRYPSSRGQLWKGKVGFSHARWTFWTVCLRQIKHSNVSDATKSIASSAIAAAASVAPCDTAHTTQQDTPI